MRNQKLQMTTCSCGQSTWNEQDNELSCGTTGFTPEPDDEALHCVYCGDKFILPGGTVEPRAELEHKAALWDRMQAGPRKRTREVKRCEVCGSARDLFENNEGCYCYDCAKAKGLQPRRDTYKP